MFIDKEFDKLWHPDNLPERFRAGQFEIYDYEKQILVDHIHKFYDYIREQHCVPLLDYAYFLEFLELLMKTGDETLGEIADEAWILTAKLGHGLEINRPVKQFILDAENKREFDLEEDEQAFEKAVAETGNPDLLTMSVRELGFSVVVENSLDRNGIEKVMDLWILAARHPKAFVRLREIGETRQKEIKDRLRSLGFILEGGKDDG